MKISQVGMRKPPKEPKIKNKGLYDSMCKATWKASPIALPMLGAAHLMKKVSKVSPDELALIKNTAQTALQQTGLKDKGVEILTITDNKILTKSYIQDMFKNFVGLGKSLFTNDVDKAEKFGDAIAQKAMKYLEFSESDKPAIDAIKEAQKKASEKIMHKTFVAQDDVSAMANAVTDLMSELRAKTLAIPYREGKNAGFIIDVNKIITPEKSLSLSVFHEMGHALNKNGGALLRNLQKIRLIGAMLSGYILMIALMNKRKKTDEKLENNSIKNVAQNGADFVKRNAGKLTAIAFLPMVLEEAIASVRGQKIAKSFVNNGTLSKKLFNKMVLSNILGLSTYILAMISAGITAKFAVDIKDKIQAKYEAKVMDKYNKKLSAFKEKQKAKELN